MSRRVAHLIDPLRMAEKSGFFKAELELSGFERLKDCLVADSDVAEFELSFEKDGNIAAIKGYVKADLKMRCQVCLATLTWAIDSKVNLAIVSSIDEADLLPDTHEPLVLHDELISISDIVEDEILLALPAIAKHKDCQIRVKPSRESIRKNPFLILNQIKLRSPRNGRTKS